jgi:thiamine biosynthesis lipoprotein
MDALLSARRRQLIAAFGAAALGAGCGPPRSRVVQFGGATMGSSYRVRLGRVQPGSALEAAARAAVAAAFDAVVRRMSTFDSGSELSRFNRHAAAAPFALSAPTMAVFARAQQVAALTGGAFDITVGPLVDAWGFGAGSMHGGAPAASTVAAPVGWRQLQLDEAALRVTKADGGLRADLSGIAKGYAVDRAALTLEALGVEEYLVEAGGEVRTRGRNGEGRPWQVAVERPDAWPQQALRVVGLSGLAMATSGDYRNFYLHGGRRYSHEIDPFTREPVQSRLASVTVVHEECMFADAMATALFVMGLGRGIALARQRQLAALFVVREGGGSFSEHPSPAFARLG